jgi:transcription initiation factor IIE alpha subunit
MDPRISLLNRLKLRLRGYVHVEDRIEIGWRKPLPFYLFKCPVHGYVESYQHGYNNKLVCPKCLEKLRKEQEEKRSVNSLLMDEANEAFRTLELKF